MDYQAKLSAPFGMLGIRCEDNFLTGIDFLPATDAPESATDAFSENVCQQLMHYFDNPAVQFCIPMKTDGTVHQEKVWQAMRAIPCGKTRSYGEIAIELHSAAQAVGQACGANPIAVVIPCHRVVGSADLGGFMKHASGKALDIKRWLLIHEGISG